MTLCQIYFQAEAAYTCIAQLGELGIVQFRDLNPNMNAFQRKFVNEVRRCDELERKLRFLDMEIAKDADVKLVDIEETCEAPKPKEMIDLETVLEQLEHDLLEVNSNKDALKKNYLELQELRHILTKATTFFEEQDRIQNNDGLGNTALSMETGQADRAAPLRLGFLAGVIDRERVPAFELMLWRICRGNVFLRTAEIEEVLEDPKTVREINFQYNYSMISILYHFLVICRILRSTRQYLFSSFKESSLRLKSRRSAKASRQPSTHVRRRQVSAAKWVWES